MSEEKEYEIGVDIALGKDETKKCDVCEKNPSIGVACVPGVPVSVAYCKECIEANAHPWWVVVGNTACIGGLEHAAPWWKQIVTDTCKHLGKTLEEFNKDVEEDIKKMNEYMDEQREKSDEERRKDYEENQDELQELP